MNPPTSIDISKHVQLIYHNDNFFNAHFVVILSKYVCIKSYVKKGERRREKKRQVTWHVGEYLLRRCIRCYVPVQTKRCIVATTAHYSVGVYYCECIQSGTLKRCQASEQNIDEYSDQPTEYPIVLLSFCKNFLYLFCKCLL